MYLIYVLLSISVFDEIWNIIYTLHIYISRVKLREEILQTTIKQFKIEDEMKNTEDKLWNQLLECSNALRESIILLKDKNIDIPSDLMIIVKKYCGDDI